MCKNTSFKYQNLKKNIQIYNIGSIFPKTFINSLFTTRNLYNKNNIEIEETNNNNKSSANNISLSDVKNLIDDGKETKAINILKKYIKHLNESPDSQTHKNELMSAYSLLSLAYTNEKKMDLAIQAIDNKISLDPLNSESYMEKANLHFNLGDFTGSVNSLAKASHLNPNDPEPYYKTASILYILKKYEYAINNALIAYELDNNHYDSIVLIAMILKLNNSKKFKKFFDMADKLQPSNPHHYCKIARIEYEKGNFESAMEYIEKAFELDPEAVEPIYLAAISLIDNGDIENGRKLLLKALSKNSDHVDSLIELAKLYMKEDKYEHIEVISERLISLAPINPVGYYFKACHLFQASKMDEAIVLLKKCIALKQDYLLPYALLANILRNEERNEEAKVVCESGLRINPEDPLLLSEKAFLLMAEQKHEEAIEIFEKINKSPEKVEEDQNKEN